MSKTKTIFISFAQEDENQRGLLKGFSLEIDIPYKFIDMADKKPHDEDWKEEVYNKVKSSDGVIILLSASTLISDGQKYEIACAIEEGKKLLSMWTYTDDRTEVEGLSPTPWNWDAIESFIEGA